MPSEMIHTQKDRYHIAPLNTKYIQQANLYKQKVGQKLPGAGRRENRELLLTEYRISVWGDRKVLEIDSGDGCTIL